MAKLAMGAGGQEMKWRRLTRVCWEEEGLWIASPFRRAEDKSLVPSAVAPASLTSLVNLLFNVGNSTSPHNAVALGQDRVWASKDAKCYRLPNPSVMEINIGVSISLSS